MDMDQQIKVFHQYIGKHHEKKSVKLPGRRKVAQKPKRALLRTLHQNRTRFTYLIRFFFCQT